MRSSLKSSPATTFTSDKLCQKNVDIKILNHHPKNVTPPWPVTRKLYHKKRAMHFVCNTHSLWFNKLSSITLISLTHHHHQNLYLKKTLNLPLCQRLRQLRLRRRQRHLHLNYPKWQQTPPLTVNRSGTLHQPTCAWCMLASVMFGRELWWKLRERKSSGTFRISRWFGLNLPDSWEGKREKKILDFDGMVCSTFNFSWYPKKKERNLNRLMAI